MHPGGEKSPLKADKLVKLPTAYSEGDLSPYCTCPIPIIIVTGPFYNTDADFEINTNYILHELIDSLF